jgi:uncharacterized membrane protein YdjX (TVP38/TMEM64 family)
LEAEVRSGLIVIGVLSLVLASCAISTPQKASDAVLTLRQYEGWAWAVGIALIWADLVLPIPQTAVIAALGIIYGTLLGGSLGSLGLITGGLLGYGLMLTSARRFVQRFVGPRSLHKVESLFDKGGAWAIVLPRSLPYSVPEAVVVLAGLAGMRIGKFIAALTIGSVPTAFVFAAVGAGWANLATDRALSDAAGSTVGDFNTGHRSPYRLPARLGGTQLAGTDDFGRWSIHASILERNLRPEASHCVMG